MKPASPQQTINQPSETPTAPAPGVAAATVSAAAAAATNGTSSSTNGSTSILQEGRSFKSYYFPTGSNTVSTRQVHVFHSPDEFKLGTLYFTTGDPKQKEKIQDQALPV